MSRAEYARYRKVTRNAIYKLEQAGQIIMTESGNVDVAQTDILLTGLGDAAKITSTDFETVLGIVNHSDDVSTTLNGPKRGKNKVIDNGVDLGIDPDPDPDLFQDLDQEPDPVPVPLVNFEVVGSKEQIKDAIRKSAYFRAQLLEYKAKLAKLKYETEKEAYIETSVVEKMAFACGRQIKESLLNIPKRLAPVVSPEIYEMIVQEIEAVLRTITVTLQNTDQPQ
jgi:hypothetical protein